GTAFDSITVSSSDTTLVPNAPGNIDISGTGSTRTLTLTPAPDLSGASTITVTATKTVNGTVASMTDTFVLTVTAVDDPPTLNAIPDPAPISEDAGQQTVNLGGISAGGGEAQTLAVTATSSNTALVPNPTVNFTSGSSTGSISYTPVPDASGTAIITVTVTETSGGSLFVTRTFTVSVTPVNDPPTLDAIADPAALLPNAGPQTVSLTGISAGGGEAQTLTVTATSNNTSLIPNPVVTYTSPNPTGSLAYTPVAGATGTAVITVSIDDGGTGTHT